MQPINQQTPGPVVVGRRLVKWQGQPIKAGQDDIATTNPSLLAAEANATLLAAAYTAFDEAGRELGVDAATLAASVDLAEVFRYALDYAQLHSAAQEVGNVGRSDQVQAARQTLGKLAALMGLDFPA